MLMSNNNLDPSHLINNLLPGSQAVIAQEDTVSLSFMWICGQG